jgi:hypothetical protein
MSHSRWILCLAFVISQSITVSADENFHSMDQYGNKCLSASGPTVVDEGHFQTDTKIYRKGERWVDVAIEVTNGCAGKIEVRVTHKCAFSGRTSVGQATVAPGGRVLKYQVVRPGCSPTVEELPGKKKTFASIMPAPKTTQSAPAPAASPVEKKPLAVQRKAPSLLASQGEALPGLKACLDWIDNMSLNATWRPCRDAEPLPDREANFMWHSLCEAQQSDAMQACKEIANGHSPEAVFSRLETRGEKMDTIVEQAFGRPQQQQPTPLLERQEGQSGRCLQCEAVAGHVKLHRESKPGPMAFRIEFEKKLLSRIELGSGRDKRVITFPAANVQSKIRYRGVELTLVCMNDRECITSSWKGNSYKTKSLQLYRE